ncbi:MAG: MFS transporter [Deferribacterales bacterium]
MYRERTVKISELIFLGSLYITQTIGFSFFIEALVSILRKNNAPLQNISFIYLLGFFWLFKFLWAPVVDRFSPLKRWKYKGWLILIQLLSIATLIATAGFSVKNDLIPIAMMGLSIGFLSSTHDVVVDALAYGLLSEKDRGIGNAVKTAGGMLGAMVGGGIGLMLYEYFGWEICIYILTGVTSVSLLQLFLFKEPEFRPQVQSRSGYVTYFFRYWKQGRLKWFILLLYYPIGIYIGYSLIAPILVDSGWRLDAIGLVVNFIGAAVGAVAAFMTGYIVRRFGRRNVLVWLSVFQGVAIMLLLLITKGHNNVFIVLLSVCLIIITYSPSATILFTIMMDQVSAEKPATDYAMQHSLYLMVGFISGFGGTALSGYIGYSSVVAAAALLAFGSALASAFLYRPHTV